MNSVVLILPYFGKFPAENVFWLKSAELNSTIDFLIISDQNIDSNSRNVHIINMSFEDCVEMIRTKLCLELSSLFPYKLCDFRPAFGLIFNDYIKDYDFWGHCDNDLVFGDIRSFITEDILNAHDRILTRGHFTLYRNNEKVNKAFMKTEPGYKEVFTSLKSFHYDEHPGTGRYWLKNMRDRTYEKIIFDDLDWHVFRFSDVHKRDTIDKNRQYFVYSFENGKLFRCFWERDSVCREEIMYVHFQKRNMTVKTDVADSFTIVPNSFVCYNANLDYKYLKENTKDSFLYRPCHFFRVKYRSLKRKIALYINKYRMK